MRYSPIATPHEHAEFMTTLISPEDRRLLRSALFDHATHLGRRYAEKREANQPHEDLLRDYSVNTLAGEEFERIVTDTEPHDLPALFDAWADFRLSYARGYHEGFMAGQQTARALRYQAAHPQQVYE